MKSRSKKYFDTGKLKTKDAPAKGAGKKVDQGNPAAQNTLATQDDTGGGNDSGKRVDQN